MKGASQLAPLGIRIPDELKTRIQDRAQKNGRSMNAEIMDIIEKSFSSNTDQQVMILQEKIRHLTGISDLKDQIIESMTGTISSQKETISALESSVSSLESHLELLKNHIDFLKNLLDEK